VALLVFYHRMYDAVLLVFPIALGFRQLTHGDRRGLVTLGLTAAFLFPIPSALFHLGRSGTLPEWLNENIFWRVFVLGHQTWAIVLLVLWATYLRLTTSDMRTGPDAHRGPVTDHSLSRLADEPGVQTAT
jgi:hypothetical protein